MRKLREDLEALAVTDPDDAESFLGYLLLRDQDAALRRVVELLERRDIHLDLSRIPLDDRETYEMLGRTDEAIADLGRTVELAPKFAAMRSERGVTLWWLNVQRYATFGT